MAYREPGVTVFQEFEDTLPSLTDFDLPNVVVGPAFHVVSDDNVGNYAGVSANFPYAGKVAGSIVDTRDSNPNDLLNYPVKVFLKNAVVRTQDSTNTGAVTGGNLNQFNDATSGVFANVIAGDVVVVTGSANGNDGSYTVRSKVSANALIMNETFAAAETALVYTVRRNLGAELVEITSFTGVVISSTQVTVPAAIQLPVDPYVGDKDVLSAEVHLQYRAQRFEQSADVAEYKSATELQAFYGLDQIVPENPVVFGVNLALQQSPPAVNLLALPRDYIELDDEILAYQNAFAVLAEVDMYAISILTFNPAVHQLLATHVNAMSDPEIKLERVGLACRELVTVARVVDEKTTSGTDGVLTATTFEDDAAEFITDGVVPGHFIKISDPAGAVGRWKIASVDSQTKLTLVSPGITGGPFNSVTYTVEKDLSKNEQADTLKAYAQSIGNRRMVMVWPDQVKIPVGSAIRTLPGFFLPVSVGAMTTALPTQQGFTNKTVAIYNEVVHSTNYFDRVQLNTIADGGYFIFVQDRLGITALKIRHQLTTNRTAVKFQEYSVTKNVDWIAKFIRDAHKAFPGEYNIVDALFDDLKTLAQRNITFMRDTTRLPRIGGKIKSGRLTQLEQHPTNIDGVVEKYKLDIPIPLNNLDITIVV